MKRSNEQSLKEVLDRLVDAYGMRQKMDELDLTGLCGEVAGAMIARHTLGLRLKRGRLLIRVDSAPLRQELTYQRESLARALNERMGRDVVKEVVVE